MPTDALITQHVAYQAFGLICLGPFGMLGELAKYFHECELLLSDKCLPKLYVIDNVCNLLNLLKNICAFHDGWSLTQLCIVRYDYCLEFFFIHCILLLILQVLMSPGAERTRIRHNLHHQSVRHQCWSACFQHDDPVPFTAGQTQ